VTVEIRGDADDGPACPSWFSAPAARPPPAAAVEPKAAPTAEIGAADLFPPGTPVLLAMRTMSRLGGSRCMVWPCAGPGFGRPCSHIWRCAFVDRRAVGIGDQAVAATSASTPAPLRSSPSAVAGAWTLLPFMA